MPTLRPADAPPAPANVGLLLLAMLPCAIVALMAFAIVPRFQELYASFGSMVPHPTALLFASHRWWGLSCLVPLAVWWWWPNRASRGGAAVVFASLLAMLMMAAGCFALYLPLTHLAAQAG